MIVALLLILADIPWSIPPQPMPGCHYAFTVRDFYRTEEFHGYVCPASGGPIVWELSLPLRRRTAAAAPKSTSAQSRDAVMLIAAGYPEAGRSMMPAEVCETYGGTDPGTVAQTICHDTKTGLTRTTWGTARRRMTKD